MTSYLAHILPFCSMKLTLCQLARVALSETSRFVPRSPPVHTSDVERLQAFLASSQRLFVLTGAGLSTESGIPDYRSEGVGLYARTDRRPVQHMDFVRYAKARQSYWARNYAGWPQFASFQPNSCHHVLSEWEKAGLVHWLVTQNVDALHTKAGSSRVTELHGCTHRVICLSCEEGLGRWHLQDMFERLNPGFRVTSDAINPDGDVVLTEEQVKDFQVRWNGNEVKVNEVYELLPLCVPTFWGPVITCHSDAS